MGNDKDKSLQAAAELRRHAEEQLQAKPAERPPTRTDAETQRLGYSPATVAVVGFIIKS